MRRRELKRLQMFVKLLRIFQMQSPAIRVEKMARTHALLQVNYDFLTQTAVARPKTTRRPVSVEPGSLLGAIWLVTLQGQHHL